MHNQRTKDTAPLHFRTRASGDSIHQRGREISGRRKQDNKDMDMDRNRGKSESTKENKNHENHGKNTKKDTSHKSAERRRKRAATLRLLSYAKDKLSQEEQKDSLLKVAKDLLIGKAKAAAFFVKGIALYSILV